jgi:transposase-like protein
MTKSKMANRYSPEVRARAVRMVFEHQGSYETQAGAIAAIVPKIGCIPQTLSGWVKQAEKDSVMRPSRACKHARPSSLPGNGRRDDRGT